MLLALLGAYSVVLIAVCWWYRPRDDEDRRSGRKESGWVFTSFGLFTLIGGGELVAGATLGYTYGWAGASLFVGYALGFIVLGLLAGRLTSGAAREDVSYVDYAHRRYGCVVGRTVFVVQVISFFALLVLQLMAGGAILSAITPIGYTTAVAVCVAIVTAYLVVGGFRAVMITDVVQGFVMVFIAVLIAWLAAQALPAGASAPTFTRPGFGGSWGVVFGGFVVGLASADVWQRLLVARSARAARVGFVLGGVIMAIFGLGIVYLGMLSRGHGVTQNENDAFIAALRGGLPPGVLFVSVLATLAAILSTADTEIFLVSSLVERELRRWRRRESPPSPFQHRYLVAVVTLATLASIWGTNLRQFLEGLYFGYMVFAATIVAAFVLEPPAPRGPLPPDYARGILVSFLATAGVFVAMAATGVLSLDNSYVLGVPALVLVPLFAMVSRGRRRDGAP